MASTSSSTAKNNPALTHTLDEFINYRYKDNMTYRNLSILENIDNFELVDHCLVDEYLKELNNISTTIDLSFDEYTKYKYAPDLLSYDVYGTTQLDFVILLINDMIDPKEFDLKKVKLPYASVISQVLSLIYNANNGYIEQNREINNIIN